MPGDSQPERPASVAAARALLHGLSVALHGSVVPKSTHRDCPRLISHLLSPSLHNHIDNHSVHAPVNIAALLYGCSSFRNAQKQTAETSGLLL